MSLKPFHTLLVLGLSVIFLTTAIFAQNPRGSLRGTVEDSTGARVVSARIVAHLSGSSLQRESSSEDRGEFRLDDLLPGTYSLEVSAPGFSPAQARVVIAVATVRDVVVMLKA